LFKLKIIFVEDNIELEEEVMQALGEVKHIPKMMMRKTITVKATKEVTRMVEVEVLVEEEETSMFLHVSSVGNKGTR
jgi:hypothetical protein